MSPRLQLVPEHRMPTMPSRLIVTGAVALLAGCASRPSSTT